MDETDVVIVGAGASGLVAAVELLSAGRSVRVVEANGRPGGRILTFQNGIEGGAEFVHGNLPLTQKYIRQSGLSLQPMGTAIFEKEKGKWQKQYQFMSGWDELMKKLAQLSADMSLSDFLLQNFGDPKYDELRASVQRYAEGYDLVDVKVASVLALRQEWEKEEQIQYRINGGYGAIIRFLESQVHERKGVIEYGNSVCKIIRAQKRVSTFLENGACFFSEKVIVTVPPGVWLKGVEAKGYVVFEPAIPAYLQALNNIGFGPVIKWVFDFSDSFWSSKIGETGFIFSNEKIPTWWTYPGFHKNRIAGWLGGPGALEYQNASENKLLNLAIESLSGMFELSTSDIRKREIHHEIVNWNAREFAYGGYSYATLGTSMARLFLLQPIEECIFFAGEALYQGPYSGMVEAALQNGKDVAQRVLRHNLDVHNQG